MPKESISMTGRAVQSISRDWRADSLRDDAWTNIASTKFLMPRQRRNLVLREALLTRACRYASERRVTLVCAPGGFGKSTLLMQMVTRLGAQTAAQCVWLTLDEGDNDINRLLVSLCGALRHTELDWKVDTDTLALHVQDAGPQARVAIAALVNALMSYGGERLLLIMDDLHRVNDPAALHLLGELIERMPASTGVIIGTRVEPAIPISRWRASGDIGELHAHDLQFNDDDACALASLQEGSRLGADYVALAQWRTQGWAAGLQLLFAAAQSASAGLQNFDRLAERQLFDYFAQEILTELPADLREFMLRCSVLSELSPKACAVLSGRVDAHDMLEALCRQNLFITIIDEQQLLVRFHDLFAEFLQQRLSRQYPAEDIARLHASAASVEPVAARAVVHWLKAQRWSEAIALMMDCADSLLAEGGVMTLTRWLAQLPVDAIQHDPDVLYLRALCALSRLDFAHALDYLENARNAYRELRRDEGYVRASVMMLRPCISIGQLERAQTAIDEADKLPLSPPVRVISAAARAWWCAACKPDECAALLADIADCIERDAKLIRPAIDDMFNPPIASMPGALPQLRRLRQSCRNLVQAGRVHWQIEAMANAAWIDYWRGERRETEAAVEQQARMTERFAAMPMLALNDNTIRSYIAAIRGKFAEAVSIAERNVKMFAAMNTGGFSGTWYRGAIFCLTQIFWMSEDAFALSRHREAMLVPRTAVEWPFIETCRELNRGTSRLARVPIR